MRIDITEPYKNGNSWRRLGHFAAQNEFSRDVSELKLCRRVINGPIVAHSFLLAVPNALAILYEK